MKIPNNAQILILPVNTGVLTAGYKNQAYYDYWKLVHYGIDISLTEDNRSTNARQLWGSGNGTVKAAGYDNIFGNVIVTVYKNVYVHGLGKAMNVTLRLYHLDKIYVKAGQAVTTASVLGLMGNTGKYTSGMHVHCEFDSDTVYTTSVPGLAGNSNIMKKGVDSTIDPANVFFIKTDSPDKQTLTLSKNAYADSAYLARFPLYPDCITKDVQWALEIPAQTCYFSGEQEAKAAAAVIVNIKDRSGSHLKAVAEAKIR